MGGNGNTSAILGRNGLQYPFALLYRLQQPFTRSAADIDTLNAFID
jgi:hypothetical protein